MNKSRLLLMIFLILQFVTAVQGEDKSYISQLADFEIQDLMNQEVSSVLRKEQPLSNAAAAIYVITKEDIKRSGSRSLPDLLRMVPGLTVARSSSGNWQITSRGFDSDGSSKLLVLIDGRSVYSPLLSSVFWDVQDVIAEDIERIEVIRGPGAVSWGENAVNGVINVITKNSSQTTGFRVISGVTDQGSNTTSLTYGEKIGPDSFYRVYGKYFSRDGLSLTSGDGSDGRSDMGHGGFRMDSKPTDKDSLTFQGDIYGGERNENVNILESFIPPFQVETRDTTRFSGGNVLLRWTHNDSKDSEIKVQTYYDRTNRDSSQFGEVRDTYDLDIQHHIKVSDIHDFVYGGDVRVTSDTFDSTFANHINPTQRTDSLANIFLQDEITILPKTFDIIPGVKLGYNDYSQFDYQPALKFLWKPTSKDTVWSSVTRAVRSPARVDEDSKLYTSPFSDEHGNTVVPTLFGSKAFDAERLYAYEVGYRTQLSKTVSFDLATFYHDYNNLLSIQPGNPFLETDPSPDHIVEPFTINNSLHGSAYGAEASTRWALAKDFDLSATYSYISINFQPDSNTFDPNSSRLEKETPHNQATLKAHWDVTDRLELNSVLYFVDSISAFDVPSYIKTDVHVGYRLSDAWQFDLALQNLTNDNHREWGTPETGVEIQKTYFGKFTYTFHK